MTAKTQSPSPASYLDFNAGAPLRPRVLSLMGEVLEEVGNASSVHQFGRGARRRIESARAQVAALVAVAPSRVVFTSGGAEANNLALCGMVRDASAAVLVSAVEHDSVIAAAAEAGTVAQHLAVDGDGVVDLEDLRQRLARLREGSEDSADSADSAAPILVSVMLANNETGVINPLREVADTAHAFGALVHCDAVQAAGKIPVDMDALRIDFMTLSSHKLGGPQGAGALILAKIPGLWVSPLIRGGGQERGLRGGTENVAAIAGFGLAAELARDGLEAAIGELAPGAEIFGRAAPRLPNTSCFTMPGVLAETQVMALDLEGVAVSAGAACSSGKVAPSRVLRAMGVDENRAACAIRVSLGWNSEKAHTDHFLRVWGALYSRKGAQSVQSSEAA